MKVGNLSTNANIQLDFGKKSTKIEKDSTFADKLSLSKEAIKMSEINEDNRSSYLNEIKNRVKNGYYDQSNVLDKVAESIINKDTLVS